MPSDDSLTDDDLLVLIRAAVDAKGGVIGQSLQSFSDFLDSGAREIIQERFEVRKTVSDERKNAEGGAPTADDLRRLRNDIEFDFTDVSISRPWAAAHPTGKMQPLFPNRARVSQLTYAGPLSFAIRVTVRAHYDDDTAVEKVATAPVTPHGHIPIIVKSSRCHLAGLPLEALKGLHEDPRDPGGYFIVKGAEFAVGMSNNIEFNALIVVRNIGREHVKGSIISQPDGLFENSSQLIIRYSQTGALTLELTSTRFERVQIPFYLLFRLLGMPTDREIFAEIVYDLDATDGVSRKMLEILRGAYDVPDERFAHLRHEIDQARIADALGEVFTTFVKGGGYRGNDDAVRYLNNRVLADFDDMFLPHVGQDPGSRRRKLRYLAHLIRRTLLVHLEVLEPTDRDSLHNKRIHPPGVVMAKALKTHFGKIVMQAMKGVQRLLRNNPFEELTPHQILQPVVNALRSGKLHQLMERAITAGDKKSLTIGASTVTNRVQSNALERKNEANVLDSLLTISSAKGGAVSKQTKRATKMRAFPDSARGRVCCARSADTGEQVGMKNALTMTAFLCGAGDSVPLREHILAQPEARAMEDTPAADLARPHSKVFVNGSWVAVVADGLAFARKYRALRREPGGPVDPHATIHWDEVVGDVAFSLDVGRIARPLFVVDNNDAEFRAAARAGRPVPFRQRIRLTARDVRDLRAGAATFEDLRARGLIEMVTSKEESQLLVAADLRTLRAEAGNHLLPYSHCDFAQSVFGLIALTSPYANHTQQARVTYQTNQIRQAGGWYSLAYPWRVDKLKLFQHYLEYPLVGTVANDYLLPCGINLRVGYLATGDNQEDSFTISEELIRRGAYRGSFYRKMGLEAERGERFETPDPATTGRMKPGASYEKLVDGFVAPGAVVAAGDVLIGRVAEVRARDGEDPGGFQFEDRSLVYKLKEPAVVQAVYRARGSNDTMVGTVVLRHDRSLLVGDKMSNRSGNKGIVAYAIPEADMPYDADGITLDIVVNPHSVPTRMTIGQMIEGMVGMRCEVDGTTADGTPFRDIDALELCREVQARGGRFSGLTTMFSGKTGEYFAEAVCVNMVTMQRLQKFVTEDSYAAGFPVPTNAETGQPLDGKNVDGGLRIGEMEGWGLHSHGACETLVQKRQLDSDALTQYFCRRCGLPAIYGRAAEVYRCPRCGGDTDIGAVKSGRAVNLIQQRLRASNVDVRMRLRPPGFERMLDEDAF